MCNNNTGKAFYDKIAPMGINSTPYLSYHEISVDGTDLYDDAWGFKTQFADVINFLGQIEPDPGEQLIARLIEKISNPEP